MHREPGILRQPILNHFFVFQGSTVAREASDKEKVSTTVPPTVQGVRLVQCFGPFLFPTAVVPPIAFLLPPAQVAVPAA